MYSLIILMGLAAIIFSFGMLIPEKNTRRTYYAMLLDASLTVENENRKKAQYFMNLSSTAYTLGRRKRKCDIWLGEDPTISREHAYLYYKDGDFYIKPLKEEATVLIGRVTNGIYEKFAAEKRGSKLIYGDRIIIGSQTLIYDRRMTTETKERRRAYEI